MTADVRVLPRALASIVADLELEEASFVTQDRIAELAARHGLTSSVRDLAWRLRRNGWLLQTGHRGVWEFAPGAHAGPYGRGDVFAVLRAEQDLGPRKDVRICLDSALWLRGLAERAPSTHQVTAPTGQHVPAGLARTYKVTHFDANLPAEDLGGLKVEAAATTLVHAAAKPGHVRSWETIETALVDLAAATTDRDLATELGGRPASVRARVGYLLSGVASDLVDAAGIVPARGVTWFGPRDRPAVRFNSRWQVADTLLPFDPTTLSAP